jgi:hypothetical protein
VLIVLDRNGMNHAPMSDDTGSQQSRGFGDPVLFRPVNIAFQILKTGIGSGGNSKADTGGGGRTLGHRTGNTGPSDVRDIDCGRRQERFTSRQEAGSNRQRKSTGPHHADRIGGRWGRSNHRRVFI